MSWLPIRLFGPDFSSFLCHSDGYEAATEPKSDLNSPNFRFNPYGPTGRLGMQIMLLIQPPLMGHQLPVSLEFGSVVVSL